MQDAPVEAAILFHKRIQDFMEHYILGGPRIAGRVLHYVIRYEVQERGSLHAHIILWVHKDDIARIAAEISGAIPADFRPLYPDDPTAEGEFQPCTDPEAQILCDMILRKNMHRCTEVRAHEGRVCYNALYPAAT